MDHHKKNIPVHLIEACKKGNRRKQRILYDTLLPSFYTVAKRYVYQVDFIEDVLQESFIRVFKNLKNYDSYKGTLFSWSIKILIRCCLKHNNGKHNNLIALDHQDISIEPEVVQKYNQEALLNILNRMPHTYNIVFKLYIIEGYAHEEIGTILDITSELSRQRLTRAKNWLRERIKKKNDLTLNII